MIRYITSWLSALCVLLALALAALWFGPGAAAQWRAWSRPQPQTPNLSDAQAALLKVNPAAAAAYPAVLERPLLEPSRRPQAAASAADAPPPPDAFEKVTLLGLLSGPTLTGVLIQDQDQSRFVHSGEKVGDWTLEAIEGRQVTFTRGSERKQLDLPYAVPTEAPGKNGAVPGRPASPKAPAPVNNAQPHRPGAANTPAPSPSVGGFGGTVGSTPPVPLKR